MQTTSYCVRMGTERQRLHVKLSVKTTKRVDQIAARRGWSRNKMIEYMLMQQLKGQPK